MELGDAFHDLVHEDAVMGNGYERAAIVGKPVFQPFHAFRIEVVGRFVEEQDVGARKQQRGQRDAHFPAAGELSAGSGVVAVVKSQSAQCLARQRLKE